MGNRLAAVADGLALCGVAHEIEGDDLIVHGGPVPGGGPVETHLDHRIAMSFLVMGSSKRRPIRRLMANSVFSGLVTA